MNQKTAILYARVSDRKQREEDVSVPSQIEAGQRRAAELGATLLRVFSDAGRTAFKEGKRPQFEAAIEFATTTGVDYFITWSSSRFARNRFEAAVFKRALDRAGVALVYIGTNIDRSTDEGWMLDSMLELMDEMFSRNNAKDTKRSMLRNAALGFYCGGRAPFGFESRPAAEDRKRRRLAPVESEVALVQRIFAMREAGLGGQLIAATFNAEGLRYRGRNFTKRSVLAILRNEASIGVTVFNRTDSRTGKMRPKSEWVIVDSHEAIVDRAQFDRVQKLMDEATEATVGGSPRSRHPFTGLLRCACGGSMVVETGKGKGGRIYSYYRCRRVRLGEPCPGGRRYRADLLDSGLSEAILSRVLDRKNLLEIAQAIAEGSQQWKLDRDRRRRALREQAEALRERNSKLYDVLELHGRAAPNLADLTERIRANSAEVKALEAELVALDSVQSAAAAPEIDLDEIAAFMRNALLDDSNAVRARAFYRTFIDAIEVDDASGSATIVYDPARLLIAQVPGGADKGVRSSVIWRPDGALLRTRRVRVSLGAMLGRRGGAVRGRAACA